MENVSIDQENNYFARVPQTILNSLIFAPLNGRELRVVLLLLRLTYGCSTDWAEIIYADLSIIRIYATHAREVFDPLLMRGIIEQYGKSNLFRVNEGYFKKLKGPHEERFKHLLGEQVSRYFSQKRKDGIPDRVTKTFQLWEVGSSHSGNFQELPNQEVSTNKPHGLQPVKDILKTLKHNPIDIDKIGDENSSVAFFDDQKLVEPSTFTPLTDKEFEALQAWELLEPDNPKSFRFYLWAYKNAPIGILNGYVNEIKTDKTINNRGKLFVWKVRNFLGLINHNDEVNT